MRNRVLIVMTALAASGCVSMPAEQARVDGCTLVQAPLFDARLLESRVSQDGSACYLEGLAPDRQVAEQQVKFFEGAIGGGCALATSSSVPTLVTREESVGYEFVVEVSRNPEAVPCLDEARPSSEPEGARVDPTSRNMNPPRYPHAAVRSGVEGRVILVAQVEANGNLGAVIVETSSGNVELDAAAVEGAARWRFHPGSNANAPVRSIVMIPVDFQLAD